MSYKKLQVARANETFNQNKESFMLICEVILEPEAKKGAEALNISYFFSCFWDICKEKGIICPDNSAFKERLKINIREMLFREGFFLDNSVIMWDNPKSRISK